MLDLPLAYELVLIITFVCLISWFMGRVLCKSKEHKERAAKKLLIREKDHLESLLANKDDEIHQLSEQLGEAQKTIAALKHHDEINSDILMTLKHDHKETLNIVQRLTTYRTQFEELSKLHDDQSKQNVNLKETLEQAQSETKQVTAHSNEQKAALEKFEEEQQDLKESSKNQDVLIAQLRTQNSNLQNVNEQQSSEMKQLTAFNEEQNITLAEYKQKQEKLKESSNNQDGLIAQLRKQNANLQNINEQQSKDISELNKKVDSYLQAANSTNVRISSMLETFPS